MDNLQTPKGFRDFLPIEAKKRQFVISILKTVFEKYGFSPLETPAIEYAEVLKGKYGEEEKLIYQFEDRGGRQVALRYDQTVPLARVVAQYPDIPKPFKRYQMQPVWRAENTQKGRYREFLQCDIDTVGSESLLADAEVIAVALNACSYLGLKDIKMTINDRIIFDGLEAKFVSAIDKLDKIGREGVLEELVAKGKTKDQAADLLSKIESGEPTDAINKITKYLASFDPTFKVKFSPTLARGLNYYTGAIFELTSDSSNSIGGGGRYDGLIGMFSKNSVPAVGFSFGFDRVVELMDEKGLFKDINLQSDVLVTIFNNSLLNKSLEVTKGLRDSGIPTEIYLDPNSKLEKQLKYADQKGLKFVIIIGPEEDEKKLVTIKNLEEKTQKQISVDELIAFFR